MKCIFNKTKIQFKFKDVFQKEDKLRAKKTIKKKLEILYIKNNVIFNIMLSKENTKCKKIKKNTYRVKKN